jgi:hypothetical protein
LKIAKKFCLLLLVLTITGMTSGKLTGDYILSSAIKGNVTFLTYIFSPSRSFIDTFSLLNSSSDYKRLAGYYAYNESGLADPDFLIERYTRENSDIIKKTIIWIAEERFEKEKLVDFYKKIYNLSPDNIQKILQTKLEN